MSELNVSIGPSIQLHDGIHGSLIAYPPPGVWYRLGEGTYHYLFHETSGFPFNPFDDFNMSEMVEFEDDNSLIHSSRIPVHNVKPWVVDMDCLLPTLLYGDFFITGSLDRIRGNTINQQLLRERQQIMLSHYLSDLCVCMIFQTEYYKKRAITYIMDNRLLSDADADRLIKKMDVIYPVIPPTNTVLNLSFPVRILYVGRTSDAKGGDLAIETFKQLKARFGERIEIIFIGELPSRCEIPRSIGKIVPFSERGKYLDILKNCHIFFSPTAGESYGMALVEAATFGLALVTTCGPGMEHIEELFMDSSNALMISNDLPREERIRGFVSTISLLVTNIDKLVEIHESNLRLTSKGKLSVVNRDSKLLHHYGEMKDLLSSLNKYRGVRRITEIEKKYGLSARVYSEHYCRIEMAARNSGKSTHIII